jgi:hypothetical protein
MAFFRGPNIVTNGLILYLDAGNTKSYPTTGTTWSDLTNSKNNGILTNGPTFNSSNVGNIVFDGIDEYIEILSPSNKFAWTPTGSGNNNITFDMWVKSTDTSGYYFSKPWNGSGEYNYTLTHNVFRIEVGNQNKSQTITSIATGNWINVTCIITPTQLSVYRNGVVDVALTNHNITNNAPVIANANEDFCIMTLYPYGNSFNQPTFSISGNTSQFKVYNRALSAAEILQNYNALKTRFGH